MSSRACCSACVSFELRKGMCFALEARALTTSPSEESDLLIACRDRKLQVTSYKATMLQSDKVTESDLFIALASVKASPLTPDSLTRSEPAAAAAAALGLGCISAASRLHL